jgi:Na+/melibiose symporter-like transporter
MQPEAAVWGIRILTGPVGAVLLLSVMVVAWYYPLNHTRYRRMQRLLQRKHRREAAQAAVSVSVESSS